MAAESEKLLSWGQGMTAYLPKKVKLFADGAIFSQAMQAKGGYADGAPCVCAAARELVAAFDRAGAETAAPGR